MINSADKNSKLPRSFLSIQESVLGMGKISYQSQRMEQIRNIWHVGKLHNGTKSGKEYCAEAEVEIYTKVSTWGSVT